MLLANLYKNLVLVEQGLETIPDDNICLVAPSR